MPASPTLHLQKARLRQLKPAGLSERIKELERMLAVFANKVLELEKENERLRAEAARKEACELREAKRRSLQLAAVGDHVDDEGRSLTGGGSSSTFADS